MTGGDPAAHRVVTVAGHVDHGKSTLLRALTGMVTDRLPQERQHGRTIELGFLWTDLDPADATAGRVAFVDVPGHARLVGTMIAGAGVAPGALLVVAGDEGVGVQTREHLDVLDLLGVPGLAVAVTRADRADPDRLDAVGAEVADLVAGTTFEGAPLVPVSAVRGEGLGRLREVLRDRLRALPTSPVVGPARLWVDRVFTVRGAGTVVTGTLRDGPLTVGATLRLPPSGRDVRVRGLQQLGTDVATAGPGTRVAVNLAGVARDDVRRGDVLVAAAVGTTHHLDVVLRVLDGKRLGRWPHRLHVGTADVACRLRTLGPADGRDAPVLVRIATDAPVHVRVGDRLIVRDPGGERTVAGGVVLDPAPLPLRGAGRGAGRRTHLARLATAADAVGRAGSDPVAVRAAWLGIGDGCRPADELRRWAGDADAGDAGVVVRGAWVLTSAADRRTRAALAAAAARGADRDGAVRDLVATGVAPAAAEAVLAAAVADGIVAVDGAMLVAPAADGRPTDRDARAAALVAAFVERRLDPPALVPTADALGVDHLGRQGLLSSGALVRCGDVVLAGAVVAEARDALRELERREGPFTASRARVELGTTRRVAIPLLEHLLRTGVTRFDGEHHRFRDAAGPAQPLSGS